MRTPHKILPSANSVQVLHAGPPPKMINPDFDLKPPMTENSKGALSTIRTVHRNAKKTFLTLTSLEFSP